MGDQVHAIALCTQALDSSRMFFSMTRDTFGEGVPKSVYKIRLVAGEVHHRYRYWQMHEC